MARPWTRTPDLRALARAVPASLLEEALLEAGRRTQRRRKLPLDLAFWVVVGKALYNHLSARNVLRRLQVELDLGLRWGSGEVPHSTSITHSCDRLGWEVTRRVFRSHAALCAAKHVEADTWRGLGVRALDGTTFKAADSVANSAAFGRPGSSRGQSGYPQLRALALMGLGSHLFTEVVLGPYDDSELSLANRYLLPRLRPGELIVMDRGFYGYAWLARVHAQGTHFLVRAKTTGNRLRFTKTRRLGRGHWIGEIACPAYLRRQDPSLPLRVPIRIVEHKKKGYKPITVITSLLDSKAYPARALGDLYHERWEIELGFRELKTRLVRTPVHLRTRTPERALQEAYGLLIAYNAIRALMAEAAKEAGCTPLELSFTDCLELTRARVQALAQGGLTCLDPPWPSFLASLACCRLDPRREGRRCQRAVKIKMSNWPRKRAGRSAAASRNRQTRAAAASAA